MGESQPLTLLTTLCSACRLEPSITVVFIQHLMETDAEMHSQTLGRGESCGRREEGLRVKEMTRRPPEPTSLGLWRFTETEPPTKEHARAGPKPPTHM